ncbi:MAG: type II toxin-antitoxin system YoeB family toxin [Bacteroidia bacterium]|nr:type II toxin-antitoxin system YoeB family toxin [Bacteroidia bacterium]
MPFKGKSKPEPLRHQLKVYWSRMNYRRTPARLCDK